MKNSVIFLIFILYTSISLSAEISCDGATTHDIEECTKNNFKSSDTILNKTYKDFSMNLTKENREILIDSQRAWIKYKETTCQGAYDATYPGEEAGIDKWSCLDEITTSRINELGYLDSSHSADSFYHALNVVSRIYEGGNRERFIEKLSNQPTDKNDKEWNDYVSKNCLLSTHLLHEEKNICIARQNFYRYP